MHIYYAILYNVIYYYPITIRYITIRAVYRYDFAHGATIKFSFPSFFKSAHTYFTRTFWRPQNICTTGARPLAPLPPQHGSDFYKFMKNKYILFINIYITICYRTFYYYTRMPYIVHYIDLQINLYH